MENRKMELSVIELDYIIEGLDLLTDKIIYEVQQGTFKGDIDIELLKKLAIKINKSL